jgi:4-hydroxythreonine-4-phosphate dehydrogenase
MYKPILGITMGDACGAGPEITAMATRNPEVRAIARMVVIGDAATMQQAANIAHVPAKILPITSVQEAKFEDGSIEVIDLKNIALDKLTYGKVNAMAGKAAVDYVLKAIELAQANEIDAIVTAPLNKEAMNLAGIHYQGHTEILAEKCGCKVSMMLVTGKLRVTHVSTHCSLREACDRAKKPRVLEVIALTDDACKQVGIENPRIAVAGLNPHAGEGGLFGDEEIKEIIPAVNEAKEKGYNVSGPYPPDTVFFRCAAGQFDAVVAMYHDMGHIAVKAAGVDEGVNVTLGLPIIRTSVDHGTVFGKAGKGTANPASMLEALNLAVVMSHTRRKKLGLS